MPKNGDEVKCHGCGTTLTYIEQFKGLPCNTYCCGLCCPYAKISPCPRDKLVNPNGKGGILGALLAHQTLK